jgi:hypothetical protein
MALMARDTPSGGTRKRHGIAANNRPRGLSECLPFRRGFVVSNHVHSRLGPREVPQRICLACRCGQARPRQMSCGNLAGSGDIGIDYEWFRVRRVRIPAYDRLFHSAGRELDAWNRLVKVIDGVTTVATYAYPGRNFRVSKSVSGTTTHPDFLLNPHLGTPDPRKPIVAERPDGQTMEFLSVGHAVECGYSRSAIYRALKRGGRHRGLYWRYAAGLKSGRINRPVELVAADGKPTR